jgi:hypothetical protein
MGEHRPHGRWRAVREGHVGPGVVVAGPEPVRHAPLDAIADRFWFHDRGALASFMWDEEAP